jgi:NAD(P)-dependent dehydrogenase (short-subunit alcohol dehydrogenase family)
MMEKRWGKIVNIASLAASRMAGLDGANYTASKYGLLGFSKHLAFEVAAHGINVNVVNPGATLTPLMASKTTAEFRAKLAEMIPLGRMISPDDIAEAVLFLASDRAAMITGVALDISGGQLLGIASDYKDNLQQRIAASEQSLKRFLEKKQPRY